MIPVPYILLYSYLRSIYYFRMRINLTDLDANHKLNMIAHEMMEPLPARHNATQRSEGFHGGSAINIPTPYSATKRNGPDVDLSIILTHCTLLSAESYPLPS